MKCDLWETWRWPLVSTLPLKCFVCISWDLLEVRSPSQSIAQAPNRSSRLVTIQPQKPRNVGAEKLFVDCQCQSLILYKWTQLLFCFTKYPSVWSSTIQGGWSEIFWKVHIFEFQISKIKMGFTLVDLSVLFDQQASYSQSFVDLVSMYLLAASLTILPLT